MTFDFSIGIIFNICGRIIFGTLLDFYAFWKVFAVLSIIQISSAVSLGYFTKESTNT